MGVTGNLEGTRQDLKTKPKQQKSTFSLIVFLKEGWENVSSNFTFLFSPSL